MFWEICGHRRPRSACASAQSDQDLRRSLTELLDTRDRITGKQIPGWDLAHAQDESGSAHFVRLATLLYSMFDINPYKPNELSHPHTLGESICYLRDVRSIFFFHFYSICKWNSRKQRVKTLIRRRIMRLGLHCLPISHKKDTRLIWIKQERGIYYNLTKK